MTKPMHKSLTDNFVKSIFEKYISREIKLEQSLEYLKIKRRRFFILLKAFKKDPASFSIKAKNKSNSNISNELEKCIMDNLKKEKSLIDNKDIPIKKYNYTFIKDMIQKENNLKVSVPTIIKRAKSNGFYIPKKERIKHEREVLTNYIGELIQHDSSHHLFAPLARVKWYLITSLDDHSRYLLFADLFENETNFWHIQSLENVFINFGIPLSYYVDSHSIFRFVQGRDSNWRTHKKITDEATPQWKQVLNDFKVNIIYALSPQAKGKIERPYQWLQDRLVRTCAREGITNIQDAKEVLKYEISRYNNNQIHSTTKEIPAVRFNNAKISNKSMFRDFIIPKPFISSKDIFCLRDKRKINGYGKISYNNCQIKINNVPHYEEVDIKIIPNNNTNFSELRFWYKNRLVHETKIKN